MRPTLIGLFAILALTALAYSPVAHAGFVYEDFKTLQPLTDTWHPLALRSVTALSFKANAAFSLSPMACHLTNVGIHGLNGVLVFLLLRALAGETRAALTSGVFLLHPLNAQAVSYVSGRTELVALTCILCAAWLATQRVTGWRLALIALSAGAAILSKESAVCVLGLVPLVWWQQGYRSTWRMAAAGLAVLGVVALMARGVSHVDAGALGSEHGWFGYPAYQAVALWRYVGLLAYPVGLTVDHDFDLVPHSLAVLALAGVLVWAALAICVRRIAPLVAFGSAWVLLSLLPRFLMRLPDQPISEHHLYSAMVGLSLVAVLAIDGLVNGLVWVRVRAQAQEGC